MIATLPFRRRTTRPAAVTLLAATAATVLAAGVATAAPADAASGGQHGRFAGVWQSTADHHVHVSGYAFDGRPGHRRDAVDVAVYINGRYARSLRAARPSPDYDKARGIHGGHAFAGVIDHAPWHAKQVRLVVHLAGSGHAASRTTDTAHVKQVDPDGQRIVTVARRYVGSRYSYGADGPRAFDCSGYSKFVYRKARVAHLPHNAQAQRHARHMHRISRHDARPGDLVFYLDGNDAYHVAIYAGHGEQYSATDPSQGVEHDRITSHDVIFETDWH